MVLLFSQIQMKLKGNRQNTGPGGVLIEGDPAEFILGLSADGETRVELPIDPTSWDDTFQAGDDEMPAAEEQPGFLMMAAIATMTLAAVYLPSKKDSEEFDNRG